MNYIIENERRLKRNLATGKNLLFFFQLQPGQHITVQPNNITIQGNATVLSDGVIKWRSIPISIKIAGYVFDVSFTGNDPNSVTAKRQFGKTSWELLKH